MVKVLIIMVSILLIFYMGKHDDVQNLTLYYMDILVDKGWNQFTHLNQTGTVILAYGPLYYLIVGLLSYLTDNTIAIMVIIPLMILSSEFIGKNHSLRTYVIFLCIPAVLYFSSVLRPDIWCLIFSIGMINSVQKQKVKSSVIYMIAVLLIKPNFIIFPIIFLFMESSRIHVKHLVLAFIMSLGVWGLLDYLMNNILYQGMIQGNLNGIRWENIIELWTSTLGLTTLVFVLCIFPSARYKKGVIISFIIASIMCLKSGANLNYYLFTFYLLTLSNRMSLKKILMISIICHGFLLTELWSRLGTHRAVIEFVHREHLTSLTFGPSYLLSHIEIEKPDAHIWRTRNHSLPQCGSAIILEDTINLIKEEQLDEVFKFRVTEGFYLIQWGNHETC